MALLANPLMIPIAAFAMVVCIVYLTSKQKQHQQELDAEMRIKEMEHARKMKEMDLELARLRGSEAEKTQA